MKKLLKEYGFENEFEYYEMIISSVVNGQRTQAKMQFNAMPKDNKKHFIKNAKDYLSEYFTSDDIDMFIDIC